MNESRRHFVQLLATLASNAHLSGFFTGRIYQGPGKAVCVPGLNCYSCPGAVGSCPIGSLQAVLGGRNNRVSYYVVGLMLLFGTVFGRFICGFLCPFGFVQELLHKLPSPKPTVPPRLDRTLRWGKYIALAAVLALPVLLTDAYGIGAPYFCKYLCPAGTLEGGLPLLAANESLRDALGWLFTWKALVLAVVVAASVVLYRPFCKYLCPLGAFYGLLNRFSLYQMEVDAGRCTHCGACARACKMNLSPTEELRSAECIRCGACQAVCPAGAIHAGFSCKAGAASPAEEPPAAP